MQISTISTRELMLLRGLETEAGARYLCQHSKAMCAIKCGGVWRVLVDERGELIRLAEHSRDTGERV